MGEIANSETVACRTRRFGAGLDASSKWHARTSDVVQHPLRSNRIGHAASALRGTDAHKNFRVIFPVDAVGHRSAAAHAANQLTSAPGMAT